VVVVVAKSKCGVVVAMTAVIPSFQLFLLARSARFR
jgi:hypothetical protein